MHVQNRLIGARVRKSDKLKLIGTSKKIDEDLRKR